MVFVSQSVSQCVCASTLVNSAGTAGPIGTGVPPIDAPIRRNDDGAIRGGSAARGTWHVPSREGLQQFIDAHTGQTRCATDLKLTGRMLTVST